MNPLFLTDIENGLGFGQQVVLALSVGFRVWYLYRAMGFGRKVGGAVGTGLHYLMAVASFVAVGIAFGWVNPFVMATDLAAGGGELAAMATRWGGDAIRTVV